MEFSPPCVLDGLDVAPIPRGDDANPPWAAGPVDDGANGAGAATVDHRRYGPKAAGLPPTRFDPADDSRHESKLTLQSTKSLRDDILPKSLQNVKDR